MCNDDSIGEYAVYRTIISIMYNIPSDQFNIKLSSSRIISKLLTFLKMFFT